MIGCLPTQSLAFLAVFVYTTHATQTQSIAFEWKPGLSATPPPVFCLVFAGSRDRLVRVRRGTDKLIS